MSVILAQDPSFRKLSFSLYDGDKTIYLDSCEYKFGDMIGFEDIYLANRIVYKQYRDKLIELGVNKRLFIDKVFSEIPPPTGMFSAGLFSLDTYVLENLARDFNIKEIWTIPPSFLMTVHNSRKYNKGESTILAKYLIDKVVGSKFNIEMKGKMNADRAESFFFLMRAFVKYNIYDMKDDIISTLPGFYSECEKPLNIEVL